MERYTRRIKFKAAPHGSQDFKIIEIDEEWLKTSPRHNQSFWNSEAREITIWYFAEGEWRIGSSDEYISIEPQESGLLRLTWGTNTNIEAIFPDGLTY
jgi:hypothetical protein